MSAMRISELTSYIRVCAFEGSAVLGIHGIKADRWTWRIRKPPGCANAARLGKRWKCDYRWSWSKNLVKIPASVDLYGQYATTSTWMNTWIGSSLYNTRKVKTGIDSFPFVRWTLRAHNPPSCTRQLSNRFYMFFLKADKTTFRSDEGWTANTRPPLALYRQCESANVPV